MRQAATSVSASAATQRSNSPVAVPTRYQNLPRQNCYSELLATILPRKPSGPTGSTRTGTRPVENIRLPNFSRRQMSKKSHRDHVHRRNRRRAAPGTAPGTLMIDPSAPQPIIRVMAYSPTSCVEFDKIRPDEIQQLRREWPVVWVNVDGLGDAAVLQSVAKIFNLHPLALEDVVNVHQRSKHDQFGDSHFLVLHMASIGEMIETEQISLFFGKDFVLTFQERPGWDCLEPVRSRIRNSSSRLHEFGSDFLMYSLVDAIIDHYFPVLESVTERLEELEDRILETPSRAVVAELHGLKRELLRLRRVMWPHREMINSLIRDTIPIIKEETRLYLRDVYDHAVRIIDLLETSRELCSDLMDLYLSSVSHRMNEVMKVLTVISTLFIPLTFIVGVYGMNFKTMPELDWPGGYFICWAIMILITMGQLVFVYRRGWLRANDPAAELTPMRSTQPAEPSPR